MFRRPTAAENAVRSIDEREVFPTSMKSWALEELPVETKRRSFFSAGVTQADFLEDAKGLTKEIADGKLDRATARLALKEKLAALEYKPDPDEVGGLKDLSSDARLNLVLDTQTDMARGYGQWEAGQDPAVLRAFPCQELVRVGGLPDAPRPWKQKWQAAGGSLYGGRMIARKDDPIWTKPISAGGFNRFGEPYPPYDYRSGMRTRDVSRRDAIALGVISEEEDVAPKRKGMNETLSAKPRREPSPELREAMRKSGIAREEDGRFVLGPTDFVPAALTGRPWMEDLQDVFDHVEKRQAGLLRKPKSSDPPAMQKRLNQQLNPRAVDLGELGSAWGVVAGKKLKLSSEEVWHVLRRHGAGAESVKDQSPVSFADFAELARRVTAGGVRVTPGNRKKTYKAAMQLGRWHDMTAILRQDRGVLKLSTLYVQRRKKARAKGEETSDAPPA